MGRIYIRRFKLFLCYEKGNDYDYRSIGNYSSLSEIIGMEIMVSNNVTFTLFELIAGLLWEVTYAERNGLAGIGMEHLTFKYLLTRFNFDDILTDFKTLYQTNAPKSFQKTDWEAYQKMYQYFQRIEVSESKYSIYLASHWEMISPLIDMNCAIYDKDAYFQPMATYSPVHEVLGMKITVACGIIMTPQELTAGLFWKIVYYGGKRIQKRS